MAATAAPPLSQPKGLLSRFIPKFLGGFGSASARPHGSARGASVQVEAFIPHSPPAPCGAAVGTMPRPPADGGQQVPDIVQPPEMPIFLGYSTGMESHYELGIGELGKGGNATVRLVRSRATGEEFACKSIPKVLLQGSDIKKSRHLDSLRREVEAMQRLQGSLNVVKLEAVYEDADYVHIVMEQCKGGELWHRIGDRHYSERTVASYMRAVLRTLAQCHSHHVLHRDIKPGNFMLLSDDPRAPLKAIDFGLAVPYEPEQLPLDNLGLEGTPWYLAPEVISSKVTPAADIWAAGVMAAQLLTGRFPFDDFKSPSSPSLSAVLRSILLDRLNLNTSWWADISDEAKDFVKLLLEKDPEKRPTAKQALQHPWLRGTSAERSTGKQLASSVVQRIQRYAQNSLFKRTVLQAIAHELMESKRGSGSLPTSPRATIVEEEEEEEEEEQQQQQQQQRQQRAAARRAAGRGVCNVSDDGRPVLDDTSSCWMQRLFTALNFNSAEALTRDQLAAGLQAMGYRLLPSEVDRLLDQVDVYQRGKVDRASFAASQLDWRALQDARPDAWLAVARRAFTEFDRDGDGLLGVDEIMAALRRSLLPVDSAELGAAVRQALEEGGQAPDAYGLSFDAFLHMLKVGSLDSLDQYDDRAGSSYYSARSPGSVDRLNQLLRNGSGEWSTPGNSVHGANGRAAGGGSGGGPVGKEGWTPRASGTPQQYQPPDGSTHSSVFSQDPLAAWMDRDHSAHDQHSKHSSVHDESAAAAAMPGMPFTFNFQGGSAAAAAAATPNGGGSSSISGSPFASPHQPAPGIVFRFDVSNTHGATTPESPPGAPLFRFDTTGAAAGLEQAPAAAEHPVSTLGGALPGAPVTGPEGSSRVHGGGYFDKRHHGADLYKASVLLGPKLVGAGAASCKVAEGGSLHRGMGYHLSTLGTVPE